MKSQILAKRFDDVIFNGKHIAGTNYHAFLQEIDYETATSQALHVNSIAHLTRLHKWSCLCVANRSFEN